MGILDNLAGKFGYHQRKPEPYAGIKPAKRAAPMPAAKIVKGRQSFDRPDEVMRAGLQFALQLSSEELWRDHNLDEQALDQMPLSRLVELICDLSPEVSKGVWDFLRLCNPGWEYSVMEPGSDIESNAGKQVIDEFIATLKERHGSMDVVISQLFLGGFLRGGIAAELVFAEDRMTAFELATPDPGSFRFRTVTDRLLKVRWQIGQNQQQGFVPLEFPTIKYIPIDPLPGKPQGRAPISAALFGAIFLLGLLHDVRRVVAQQGWPRLDIEVMLEALAAALPDEAVNDPDEFKRHVEDVISQVKEVYSALEPDDTYIHTSVTKVNSPVGTVDSKSLSFIDKLIETVERLTIRGLKSIPLLHGVTDGVSEANANRQWEIHVAGIKSIQHLVESLLESLLGLVLQARGIQARVDWKFAELRAAEMLRDAQTEALRIRNERDKYNAGWISQDEAALMITGHAADLPEPRSIMMNSKPPTDPASAQPDASENRGQRNAQALALLLTTDLTEPPSDQIRAAEQYWRDNAPEEAIDLIDAELVD